MAPAETMKESGESRIFASRNPDAHRKVWRELNVRYMTSGLVDNLDKAFILSINEELRKPAIEANPTEEPMGLCKGALTRANVYEDRYYTSGYGIESELDEAILEGNRDMSISDINPILLAAKVY